MATISEGFKYPFVRFRAIWSYWWILVPIIGYFSMLGYVRTIVKDVLKGNTKELPKFGSFWNNIGPGFMLFLLGAIYSVVYVILGVIPFLGVLLSICFSIISVVLIIQYIESGKFEDGLNVVKATKVIINNIEGALLTLLKSIVVYLGFLVASVFIITLLVTLPGMTFSPIYLWADFYRTAKKPKK